MGTTIQLYKLTEEQFRGDRFKDWKGKDLKGNNELLNITRPQVIEEIHRRYYEAGADIAETNTFNGQRISLADYGMESLAYELARAGAECARRAADAVMVAQPGRKCWVAGAIGPTTKTSSISTDVNDASARGTTWDELVAAYGEQARALLDGGSDVLLVETVFDTLNAKAAFFAIQQYSTSAAFPRCRTAASRNRANPLSRSWPPSPLFKKVARAESPARRRGVLEFHFARASAQRRHELRARPGRDAPAH